MGWRSGGWKGAEVTAPDTALMDDDTLWVLDALPSSSEEDSDSGSDAEPEPEPEPEPAGRVLWLVGPAAGRRALTLGPGDGLAAVLAASRRVGVEPHDACVWLLDADSGEPRQVALVGRPSERLRVVGSAPLATLEGLGDTLHVLPRGHAPPAAPPRRECRICAGEADTPLISPCGCRGTVGWVHSGCLQQWRRANTLQSRYCSVCGQEYNCIREVGFLDYLAAQWESRSRSPLRAVAAAAAAFCEHCVQQRCGRHLACVLTRVVVCLALLASCAVLGRLVAGIVSETVNALLVFDSMLDELFLPDMLLALMHRAFPPLLYELPRGVVTASAPAGVAVSPVSAVAAPAEERAATGVLAPLQHTPGGHVAQQARNNSGIAMSWEDTILSVLTWCVLVSLSRQQQQEAGSRHLARLQAVLHLPLTLLSDCLTLVMLAFPSRVATVHFLALVMPMGLYASRRLLCVSTTATALRCPSLSLTGATATLAGTPCRCWTWRVSRSIFELVEAWAKTWW